MMGCRPWLQALLVLTALATLFTWLLPHNALRDLPVILRAAAPWQLALALSALLASVLLRALRLHVMLAGKREYWHTLLVHNVGAMVNCLLPLRSGELCMAMLLGRRLNGGASEALSRLFVDRLVDFLVLAALAGAAIVERERGQAAPLDPDRIVAGAGFLILLVICLVWIARSGRQQVLCLLDRFITNGLGRNASPWLERADRALEGLHDLLTWRRLLPGICLSIAGWAVLGLNLHGCMQATAPAPGLSAALLGLGVITVGLIAAPLPSGLGTTHGAIVLAYGLYGVEAVPALAGAIIYHAMGTALALLLGFLSLPHLGLNIGSLLLALRSRGSATK